VVACLCLELKELDIDCDPDSHMAVVAVGQCIDRAEVLDVLDKAEVLDVLDKAVVVVVGGIGDNCLAAGGKVW